MINIKRIYDEPHKNDGYRVLVDRLWPRGIKKESANLNEWAKELSPSPQLRKWFNHLPEKWNEFKWRYTQELQSNEAVETFLNQHKHERIITLLYATKVTKYSHAIVLQNFLSKKIKTIR